MDKQMAFVRLKETNSTNSWIREHLSEINIPALVIAESQTAGRGQRGNSWEAEPGKNLTFSIVWRPVGMLPSEQFALSEAVALGVRDYLGSRGIEASVKWPNDIYVGDRKICGILIEHSILGSSIERSIIGVGVNVNQREFHSDAPNPVSMTMLTELEYNLEREGGDISEYIRQRLTAASDPDGRSALHRDFMASLWRGDGGWYSFRDVASGRLFSGRIEEVASDGRLTVIEQDTGIIHVYAFKEVEFQL